MTQLFVVQSDTGAYSDRRTEVLCVCETEELAQHMVERMQAFQTYWNNLRKRFSSSEELATLERKFPTRDRTYWDAHNQFENDWYQKHAHPPDDYASLAHVYGGEETERWYRESSFDYFPTTYFTKDIP